ncbi:hypothetical protein [Leptospira licerasiae]|uniref:hypothetical protein n=1 Tax=Leptospira licerasiae TaxID=447106 RepID=UPI000348EAAA
MNVLFQLAMKIIALILFSIIGSVGCILSTSLNSPMTTFQNPANVEMHLKKKVLFVCEWSYLINGNPLETQFQKGYSEKSTRNLKVEFDKLDFLTFQTGGDDFDYKLIIKHKTESNTNFGLNFLSAITLLIIPGMSEKNYQIDYQLFDRNGNTIKRSSFRAGQEYYQQILLIFVMPFKFPLSEENNVLRHFAKSVTSDLYHELLENKKNTPL